MLERRLALDPKELRVTGAVMLAAGATLPFLPAHPSVACPLRMLTGVPCPLCGMTTSVEATVRLDLHDALAANPAGVVAVVVAVLLLAFGPRRLNVPSVALPIGLAAMWLFELHRFSII
jgi:hypothetical protein